MLLFYIIVCYLLRNSPASELPRR